MRMRTQPSLRRTATSVIALMEEQMDLADMGGTMRLGAYPCRISPDTLMMKAYGKQSDRRHRHRYEFNNKFRKFIWSMALSFRTVSGRYAGRGDDSGHLFYLGVQYHPEFKSRPNRAHPIFRGVCESGSGGKGKILKIWRK